MRFSFPFLVPGVKLETGANHLPGSRPQRTGLNADHFRMCSGVGLKRRCNPSRS
jgi:hypothetical protein